MKTDGLAVSDELDAVDEIEFVLCRMQVQVGLHDHGEAGRRSPGQGGL